HFGPQMLDPPRVLADQERRQLILNDPGDVAAVRAVVAVVNLARQPARGADARDDRVAAGDAVAAAAEHLFERDLDRDRLDSLDLHAMSLRMSLGPLGDYPPARRHGIRFSRGGAPHRAVLARPAVCPHDRGGYSPAISATRQD